MPRLSGSDMLASAIAHREIHVQVNYHGTFNGLMRKTVHDYPKVLAVLEDAQAKYTIPTNLTGALQGTVFDFDLRYYADSPSSIDEIVLDDGTWTPTQYVSSLSSLPEKVSIVTNDRDGLWGRCETDLGKLQRRIPGLRAILSQERGAGLSKEYSCLVITFDYGMPVAKYEKLNEAADSKARMIISQFGNATVPKFVKAFMALSYLQTNCTYDEATWKCIEEHREQDITRPESLIAYGPLVLNLGVCSGIAQAYKLLVENMGIPCSIIEGQTGANPSKKCHEWNMVEIGNRYYHVDVTCGIDETDVCVQLFMKTDSQMRASHQWDATGYQHANGTYYDVDYICDYIEEHESELLGAGAEAKYLLPTLIM